MLEKQIAELESRPEAFVSDSVVGSQKNLPYQPHTIVITGYGNEHQGRINTLRAKYAGRQQKVCAELEEIETFIGSLEDSRLRQIIEYRYVKGLSWDVVAKNVYGYPCGDTARMIVKRFFEKF